MPSAVPSVPFSKDKPASEKAALTKAKAKTCPVMEWRERIETSATQRQLYQRRRRLLYERGYVAAGFAFSRYRLLNYVIEISSSSRQRACKPSNARGADTTPSRNRCVSASHRSGNGCVCVVVGDDARVCMCVRGLLVLLHMLRIIHPTR